MAPKVQVQPGFLPPGDDVMALVNEVGNSLKAILKNEQTVADLKKSEKVATSDPQTLQPGGGKGSGEHVATSDPQVGLGKAERSPIETSSSGGGRLPVKKGEYSESSSSSSSPSGSPSASPFAKGEGSPHSPSASASGSPSGSPSAGEGAPPEGSPEGAPPAGDPSAPAGGEAPAAAPSFEELVQMYSQLPPEDLQAHMAAIEQAAQSQAGAAPGAPGAPAGGPPGMPGAPPAGPGPSAGAMPPPSAGPGPSAPPPGAPPDMPPMGKSEAAGYMAELKKTQDQVGAIAEALTAVLTLPKRKAMDGFHIVPFQKSEAAAVSARPSFEELKKNSSALHAELKKMTMPDSDLKKSERDLVTDFYCRRISVEELAPLFQVKK